MNERIKTPKGIKIIAGLMFVYGLIGVGMHLSGLSWVTGPNGKTTFSISMAHLQFPGKFAETIMSETLDETGKVISPSRPVEPEYITSVIHRYAQDIASLFWALLFVIAGIGLWKIKSWGLLLALIALTARISLEVVLTPLYLLWVNEAVGTPPMYWKSWIDVMNEGIGGGFPPLVIYLMLIPVIFAIISIVYLWKNRRCF